MTKVATCESAIPPYRICKPGASDGAVLLASAGTDKLMAVNDRIAFAVAGDRGDVVRLGIAEVEYGATVAAGDALTADASGRAVVAAPAAGANVRIIGFAEVAGVVGDIGSMMLRPSLMQG
ncbi:DUF2190 domain-containing protein [Xenophilus aerolatus]|nr:DUF2190 domain-containing protein [Xenophilus aerolatus]